MYDSEVELRIAEEKVKKLAESIENKTIFEVDFLDPHAKRILVEYVTSDSKYYNSFKDYLIMIANKIAENIFNNDQDYSGITECRVMFEHVLIQDDIFADIGLNSNDSLEITKLVNEKMIELRNG